ncbi:hypothetical protein OPT61_g3843 [Boeremia exigua]|uniref:Uncharacterized protein n=1 Tax=Boeremia exigua TaxID=749465 RepID=A0ACC2IGJ9_9PLEO|nr:hypothetical protein OPT61_g3843 [Boeremia exigua]
MHTTRIIALSLGLGIPFLIVMALVSRLFVHRHSKSSKQDIYTVDGNNGELYRIPRRSGSWKQLFASKQKDQDSKWVPTLSGIVKAGDEGLWSSALFTNPHGHPGEISFEAICEMFANELRTRSMTVRSAYSGEIGKFVNSAKRGATSPKRVQSVSHKRVNTGRADVAPPGQRRSLDISSIERGLGRSLSIKRPAPLLVPTNNGLVEHDTTSDAQRAWMKDGRPAEYLDGQMGVKITSGELAVLCLLLGSSITIAASNTDTSATTIDKGAFNISINSTSTDDGKNVISLRRHKRNISQLLSGEAGHSPLFARHLACGSLPFSQDARSISSILITDDALETIRSGIPVTIRRRSQQTPPARFLTTIPSLREPAIHVIEASTKSSPATPLLDAISQFPFVGGLTPLASRPLIETVRFVASGGLHPGRLLQRLEGLVDKVQRQSPHLKIFGPLHEAQNAGLLFRERERLGKVATGAITEELADKVARMQRYVTLLQRLMALVPDMKPQEVLIAVQEATKKELSRSYADAVDTYNCASASTSPAPTVNEAHCPKSDARSNRRHASSTSRPSARRSPRSSLGSGSNGTLTSKSARFSMTFPEHNLGKQTEMLLKSELPFSVEMVAMVARLVLVAWTLSVGTVAWGEDEEGFRVPEAEAESPHKSMLLV